MNQDTKQKKLQQHKNLALGLLLLMLVLYITAVICQRRAPQWSWVGYLKAFSEAAMVGALADWFAVVALFRRPMGLNIPHTNLIEARKNDIGENLGTFVVENFLKFQQIRPYIAKIKPSSFLLDWLSKESTPAQLTAFIESYPLHTKASTLLVQFLKAHKHEGFLSDALHKVASYLDTHRQTLERQIDDQFPMIVPAFIREAIAEKVAEGLYQYILKMAQDPSHPIREELTQELYGFAQRLNTPQWQQQLTALLQKGITHLTEELRANTTLQAQLDTWAQKLAYQFVLRNKQEVGRLISATVAQWEGRQLSEKLELEVGKDLQFIRVNGTLVGGLVGLIIYFITQLF
ncbi:hypothetical protein HMPREF1551_02555 [Capnocytophaga sp. oral taxon 863 str. F0517]|uniref:DUF445 domain-containing protein n=1 Tax=Capnocytophaga sp. oral taxon 863 TaxID=1227265 RepID=UPI000396E570|nr:DUF445 domain-containing protein [Capnocytophaga sp. oral taxon 863]ERI61544.1 hypothetical protein HMPREF1551_02555 [Capnocytophaga sp. oral taxon 863 str. F0517]